MERGDGGGGGGMAPRGGVVGSAAMLGLDMRLAPQQMHPAAAFQHQHQQGGFQLQQPAPVTVAVRQQQAPPPSSFSPYSNTSSSRVVVSAAMVGHDDDDMVGNGGGKVQPQPQPQMAAAACPWTRMKWTDAMVRLLIGVVHSVGDDGEGVATASGGSKAGRAGHGHGHAAAAQQQKKGKWKSVSQAMMDHGFVVSPQQCEDKFNDLNKRYKRVVDLLGRGRACRVVENHALLDTLDGITPKAKDEARKLLSSKHLFFPEMCSYHNNTAGAGPHVPPHGDGGAAACLHHPLPAAPVAAAASSAARHHALHQAAPSPPAMKDSDDEDSDDDSDDAVSDDDSDEDDSDEEEEESGGPMFHSNQRPNRQHIGGRTNNKRGRGEAEDNLDDEAEGGGSGRRARRRRKKKRRVAPDPSAMLRQLKSELASASTAMDPQQARSWMRRRAVKVEEQQILLDSHAVYLDRQRLKWEQFRGDKERDMERARLQNDRFRMESRRLLLMLRHKDIDLDMAEANSSSVDHHPGASPIAAHHHQQQPVGSSPSPSVAGHPN